MFFPILAFGLWPFEHWNPIAQNKKEPDASVVEKYAQSMDRNFPSEKTATEKALGTRKKIALIESCLATLTPINTFFAERCR